MSLPHPELDYESSAAKLSEWLRTIKTNRTSPTKAKKEYRALAEQLEAVADLLDEPRWSALEAEHDRPETGPDGWPIAHTGRYQGTVFRLRDIATDAYRLADDYPNARAKPEHGWAAAYFLHLWLEAGRDRPTSYDDGEAVEALGRILKAGGYPLSPSRVRGILTKALQAFDPTYHPCGSPIERFFVYRE